jgi:hypothetical protein
MTPQEDVERVRFLRRRLAIAHQTVFHVDDVPLVGLSEPEGG